MFIGFRFNTIHHRVFIPQKRLDKLVPVLQRFLVSTHQTALQWESLLGLLVSTEKVVPLGRCHMRGLQRSPATQWDRSEPSNAQFLVCGEAITDLRWWLSLRALHQGMPTQLLPVELEVFTDSSTVGWGAHCGDLTSWSHRKTLLHITNLEFLAALLHWVDIVSCKRVLVITANTK